MSTLETVVESVRAAAKAASTSACTFCPVLDSISHSAPSGAMMPRASSVMPTSRTSVPVWQAGGTRTCVISSSTTLP